MDQNLLPSQLEPIVHTLSSLVQHKITLVHVTVAHYVDDFEPLNINCFELRILCDVYATIALDVVQTVLIIVLT